MGSLTPGATYIYESPDGGQTVYARESGRSTADVIRIAVREYLKKRHVRYELLW